VHLFTVEGFKKKQNTMKKMASELLLAISALIVGTGIGVNICFWVVDYPEKWMNTYTMYASIVSLILTIISIWLKSTNVKNAAKKY